MTASTVQIPPDSTGKKIATTERRHVGFDNRINGIQIGNTIVGQTSGAQGIITSLGTEGYPADSGVLHLKDATGAFTDNEVLEISSTPVANVAFNVEAETNLHIQQVIISDPDDPHNRQKVDRFGATVNTFTDGSPIFTPFGAMSVGQTQPIRDYRFAYDGNDSLFWDQTVGGGSISHEQARGTILLQNGTVSGDQSIRTSHFYHPYIPGVGSQVEMSIQLGGADKANLVQCWGLFDGNNGLFFESNESGLAVVMRSSVSGSPVDLKINQVDFNKDKADGSDSIGLTLDVTKGNVYFIDFQWLGAGRVHFGMLAPTGERIILHAMEHANTVSLPYMKTATLPIRVEQINTGAVVSTSEMRWLCGTVNHTSLVTPDTDKYSEESPLVTGITAAVPVISFRPTLLISGLTNRVISAVESIQVVNTSSEAAIITVTKGTSLTGGSFSLSGTSAMEKDTSASAHSGGTQMRKIVVGANSTETLLFPDRPGHGIAGHLLADGTTQPIVTISAKSVTGVATDIAVIVNWGEMRF